MTYVHMYKQFTCYICEKVCNNNKKGAHIGSTTIRSMAHEICSDCVHKNYCWATDKDLQRITTSFLDKNTKSRGLIHWGDL